MDDIDFIRPRVEGLLDHSEEIYSAVPGPTNDFDTWSALKLIVHSVSVATYTRVHGNQEMGDIFYIDALAGTGLSTYEDGYFLGSALLALREAEHPFSKMYFVEGNNESADILEERIQYAFGLSGFSEPEKWEVINEDCNEAIPDIVSEMRESGSYDEGFNYYCFIDNAGLDFEWRAIEELTPTPYGDLLINIPIAHPIGRLVNQDNTEKLNGFYGEDFTDTELQRAIRSKMLDKYLRKLATRNRPQQVVTEVHAGRGSYRYDLAYVCRETGNGNPWLDAIRYARDFIENFHGGDIKRILDVIHGDQSTYEDYLPEVPIDQKAKEELESDSDGRDHSQSGLSDFH